MRIRVRWRKGCAGAYLRNAHQYTLFLNPREINMRKSCLLFIPMLLVGCSRGPVDPGATRHDSPAPRFDGGGMVGSGNFAPIDSSKTSRASAPFSAEALGDSVGRGGGMVGSGN